MKQKFDTKELKHSKRIFKSATPKGDLSWYIKWIASIFTLTAMSIRGIEELLHYDLILSIIGVSGWLIVSLLWKDRALIMLNAVGLIFLLKNVFINTLFS